MKNILEKSLPFWNRLTLSQKNSVISNYQVVKYKKNTILQNFNTCSGVHIIQSGRVRAFKLSPNGKEITLYHLIENEVCMVSFECLIECINFGVSIEMVKDSEIAIIPKAIYLKLMLENSAVHDFTLELVSSRFSKVLGVLEQLVFTNASARLAKVLIQEKSICNSSILEITHEKIAYDLGTAREVVTRLLKKFQIDGLVKLSRGKIEITNENLLLAMAK